MAQLSPRLFLTILLLSYYGSSCNLPSVQQFEKMLVCDVFGKIQVQAGAELCQAQLSLKLASLIPQLLNCLTACLLFQPQLNLNTTSTELGLTWKWVCTPPHPTTTHPPKLNFHHKEPQINLSCCLNNNINFKDNNNNKYNVNNDNDNKNNNNNNKTKQPQNNWVVTISK